ncbi:MAG TPA: hypothetical protein VH518_08290, partial [Tepidisphaeraceae bacterium]
MTTLPQTTSTSIQLPRPMSPTPLAHPMGAPAGAGASPVGMTGADVWRVIRSNIWLIIGSIILSGIIGLVLNWYLLNFHARYTAVGYVQVQPGRVTDFLNKLPQAPYDSFSSLPVEQRSQAAMLHTPSLFAQVLSNVNADIRKTDWFRQFKKADGSVDIAAAKDDLDEKFVANPIADSKLIAVSFTYNVPKDCRTVVMDIVNQHLENERKRSFDRISANQTMLTTMHARYQSRIRDLRNDTSVKAAKLQLDGWGRPGGVSQKEQELGELISQRLKAEGDAQDAQGAYEGAAQQIQQGITPAAVESMVGQHPMVMQRKNEVDSYDIQIAANLDQGDNGKMLKQLKAYRDAAQIKLDEIRASETASTQDMYIESLRNHASGTQHQVESLNKQIDKVKSDLSDMTNDLSDYLNKKDEEQGYQELAKRVRDQLDVLQNQANLTEMNTVTWGPQPETPDSPSFPRLPIVLAGCTALGLALSLGIAFIREITDQTVRSPRDIARVGQMNLLGMIPHEDDDPQSAGVPLPTIIYAAPTSMMAEQFRQVRTRLQHAASLDTTRSILVTSPGPEDGKSTIACNLAAGLALNGRKILLVDSNFRRPELHKIFDLANEAGFGTVLSSVENFEGAVRQTKVPNLDVMTTGPKPANATELLESQLLIDFIERALEEYDHVIFDSG